MIRRVVTGACVALIAFQSPAAAQSLRGSPASVEQQYRVALEHDFTFLQTPADVQRFVTAGYLVPVRGNANYELAGVSYPYARPEVRLFIERLASQYHAACGEKLVVTSLTRPRNQQPANASPLSVHPAGMAVDLRVSQRTACRNWLEQTLLSLEGSGVLNATRETNPPHYHVALFPRQYAAYVDRIENRDGGGPVLAASSSPVTAGPAGAGVGASLATTAAAPTAAPPTESSVLEHRVGRGESLWLIAQRYGTSVAEIQRANGLSSTQIQAGQILRIPGAAMPAIGTTVAHRVANGESLWLIAQRYGTTVTEIQRANGMTGSRIVVGQTLQVPVGRAGAAAGSVATTYRVATGDSLWTIAQRHGTTVDALRRANGLGSTSRIYPGQVLQIPGS